MTAGEFFSRVWEMLIGRTDGPMSFRVIMQPTVAVFFAIRAGLRDARAGQVPYLSALVNQPDQRRRLLLQGWKDIGKVFIVAMILDAVYELIVYRWIYPGQAVIAATVLSMFPYLLLRGPVNRLMRRVRPPADQNPIGAELPKEKGSVDP